MICPQAELAALVKGPTIDSTPRFPAALARMARMGERRPMPPFGSVTRSGANASTAAPTRRRCGACSKAPPGDGGAAGRAASRRAAGIRRRRQPAHGSERGLPAGWQRGYRVERIAAEAPGPDINALWGLRRPGCQRGRFRAALVDTTNEATHDAALSLAPRSRAACGAASTRRSELDAVDAEPAGAGAEPRRARNGTRPQLALG